MRMSDWSSDVCSSDLAAQIDDQRANVVRGQVPQAQIDRLAHRPRRASVAIGEPGREVGSERFVGPAADPGFLVGADVDRAAYVRLRTGEPLAVVYRPPVHARRGAFAPSDTHFGAT